MAMQTNGDAADKSTLSKLALPGAVAAVSAGVGLLFTVKPKRLRDTLGKLPGGAQDLMGDLKERAGSMGGAGPSEDEGERSRDGIPARPEEFEARRRERKERREQRRQHAKT